MYPLKRTATHAKSPDWSDVSLRVIIGNRIQPFTCQTRVKTVYAECSRHGCYILHKHTFSNDSATSVTISESPGDSEIVTLVALSLLKYVFLLQVRSQSFRLFLL